MSAVASTSSSMELSLMNTSPAFTVSHPTPPLPTLPSSLTVSPKFQYRFPAEILLTARYAERPIAYEHLTKVVQTYNPISTSGTSVKIGNVPNASDNSIQESSTNSQDLNSELSLINSVLDTWYVRPDITKTQSDEVPLFRHSPLWTVVLCIAYLIVFFLGLIGNSSVLWVIFILRRKSSRHSMFANCNKVFNGLIGNLALADLLVIIFCLPATLISNIIHPWILGRFLCKSVQYCQSVSVSASVYTLVAISIDRFYGIYYPFANGFSTLVRRSVIIFIWVLSFSIAVPWILYFDIVKHDNPNLTMCQEVWPDEQLQTLYFLVVNLGLQYLVPLSIILIFYVLLLAKIWRRKIPVFHTVCKREMSTDTVDQWNARIVEHSKMKVLKMLIMIVSLFALSWLPLYIIFLWIKFGTYEENSLSEKLVIIVTPLAQWLGASNSCVNPILYFFFNAKFRAYLKKAITRSLLCSSSVEYTRNHIYHQQFPASAHNQHHRKSTNAQTATNLFNNNPTNNLVRPGTPSTAHTGTCNNTPACNKIPLRLAGSLMPSSASSSPTLPILKTTPTILIVNQNSQQPQEHLLKVPATKDRIKTIFDDNHNYRLRRSLLLSNGTVTSLVSTKQSLSELSQSSSGSLFTAVRFPTKIESSNKSRSINHSFSAFTFEPDPEIISTTSEQPGCKDFGQTIKILSKSSEENMEPLLTDLMKNAKKQQTLCEQKKDNIMFEAETLPKTIKKPINGDDDDDVQKNNKTLKRKQQHFRPLNNKRFNKKKTKIDFDNHYHDRLQQQHSLYPHLRDKRCLFLNGIKKTKKLNFQKHHTRIRYQQKSSKNLKLLKFQVKRLNESRRIRLKRKQLENQKLKRQNYENKALRIEKNVSNKCVFSALTPSSPSSLSTSSRLSLSQTSPLSPTLPSEFYSSTNNLSNTTVVIENITQPENTLKINNDDDKKEDNKKNNSNESNFQFVIVGQTLTSIDPNIESLTNSRQSARHLQLSHSHHSSSHTHHRRLIGLNPSQVTIGPSCETSV